MTLDDLNKVLGPHTDNNLGVVLHGNNVESPIKTQQNRYSFVTERAPHQDFVHVLFKRPSPSPATATNPSGDGLNLSAGCTMIRRFDLIQADILTAFPSELKSAVRTGFLAQTETKISDVSDGFKVPYAYAREKLKRKVLKLKSVLSLP